MECIRVKIYTSGEACELLADTLAPICGGCEIDDPRTIEDFVNNATARWDYIEEQLFENPARDVSVSFYIQDDADGQQVLREVALQVAQLKEEDATGFYGSLKIELQPLGDVDWENSWKQYYKPFCVGGRLLVCPSWETAENPDSRVVLTIDPASSFGTGSHATTRLCMEQLDSMTLDGAQVLDVGCGSGILATTAMLLGAGHAVACDIEENAMTATRENMEKNGIGAERYETVRGDLLQEKEISDRLENGGPYDVILANIVADVLMAMADHLLRWLKPDGTLILSGIIDSRAEEVVQAYLRRDMQVACRREKDGWVMLSLQKKNG